MASPELKYKGMTFKIENRKYNVKVTVRKGEEDKVSAKHHGLKGGISGGYFSDPFEAAQMADK